MKNQLNKTLWCWLLVLLTMLLTPLATHAGERDAAQAYDKARSDPTALRGFLLHFPKGGDLHNHIDGAVYAENMIRWAAEDGRCVNLDSYRVSAPPCDAADGRPPVAAVALDSDVVNRLIDAWSTRNFERRPVSGAVQFFSTFPLFYLASVGREGDMLSEVALRAARQNTWYLELMQSWGMGLARASVGKFPGNDDESSLARELAIDQAATESIAILDAAEHRRSTLQACGQPHADPACAVQIAYLAQVLRTFPKQQVRAQTKLAVRLMQRDPRIVGLNFVAPENAPITLRDYSWQMQMIAEETRGLPAVQRKIALHAGELTLGLVPPEDLGFHVRDAVEVAGASRIGHGIDIIYDAQRDALLARMADDGIAVEINLTSNATILGVSGAAHPFNLYRQHGVPLTLSTDDEGVSRIDLTHEYQRAVESYNLSYAEIKQLARNALQYSFQPGQSLFEPGEKLRLIGACRGVNLSSQIIPATCQGFLSTNRKAHLQWLLEQRFEDFEDGYR